MTALFNLDVDGQLLRVARRSGRSDVVPLLLINGLGASLELLEPFAQALGDIETIRIDLPGTGGSPASSIPYRPSGLATLLNRALDLLGCQTVDVLGISLGGAITQQLAWQHADRIRRVVLRQHRHGCHHGAGSTIRVALDADAAPASPIRTTWPTSHPSFMAGGLRTNPELAAGLHRVPKSGGTRGYYWQLLRAHRLDEHSLVVTDQATDAGDVWRRRSDRAAGERADHRTAHPECAAAYLRRRTPGPDDVGG